ncbi:MAG TPA: ATP-binding protein [Candidatus Eremiobacteraeota bacterium]|nr:ATP-binding protein [Candidatus Eremiobacteraeota bacterium]
MTFDTTTIIKLIRGGETLTVEFKSEKSKQISDHEIYENIVCLANSNGGVLLIGIENDGTITGARPRHGNTTEPNLLKAAIFNNTAPPVNTSIVIHKIGG